MATIGSLVVDLKMDLAKFSTDIAKGQRDINTFTRNAERSFTTMTRAVETGFTKISRLAGILGIALGARELVQFGRGLLSAADQLDDMSRDLGISIGLLQSLQFAAHKTGISSEQLEGALGRLAQTFGDALAGNRQAVEALDHIGVKLLDAQGKFIGFDAALRDTAEGLASLGDETLNVSRGSDLMGRGYRQVAPLFRDGAAGIDEATAAAREAGVVLNKDMNERLAAANAKIAELSDRMKAWASITLAETVIPAIEKTGEAIEEMNKGFDASANRAEAFRRTGQALHDAVAGPDLSHPVADGGLFSTSPHAAGLPVAIAAANRAAGRAGVKQPAIVDAGAGASAANRIADLIRALDEQTAAFGRTNREKFIYEQLSRAEVSIDSASGRVIADKAGNLYRLTQAYEAHKAMSAIVADAAAQEDQDRIEAISRGRELDDQRLQAIANIEREMQGRERLINAIGQGNHAYEVELKFQEIINSNRLIEVDTALRLAEAYVNQNEKLEQMRASATYLSDHMEQAFDRVGSAITQAFADGSTAAIDFGGIVKGVISEIIQMLLELSVINPLKNALFDMSLPTIGTVLGGGGSSLTPFGNNFGPMGTFDTRASGGPAMAGHPYIIGEEGPELFVPRHAGTVIPHSGFGGGRGDSPITVYVGQGVNHEQMQMVRAEIVRLRSEVPGISLRTVVNDRQRWGTSRKAFRG